jgi:hypothetical protein
MHARVSGSLNNVFHFVLRFRLIFISLQFHSLIFCFPVLFRHFSFLDPIFSPLSLLSLLSFLSFLSV